MKRKKLDKYFERFERTGSVLDYLRYRSEMNGDGNDKKETRNHPERSSV